MPARDAIADLQARMGRSIIGQEAVIERLVIGLLADGHLLVEGLPGLAKTRAVKSLAKYLDAPLSRIQFTPDLLPSDVTGSEVYYQTGGSGEFKFQPGPVFSNLVLADEINRAPAKVQAALLEAMEERQVTVAGTTHPLPPLFLVMATQNPIEQEGTYPLPEAQMDRFLMHVLIGYPDVDAEQQIVRLVRGEEAAAPKSTAAAEPPVAQQVVFDARSEVHGVAVAPAIERYVADLVFATRYPEKYGDDLRRWIQVGASPRGSLALDRCARAHAWLHGGDHVTPDDVRAVLNDCLRHRLILSYEAKADGRSPDDVLKEIAARVAVA
jgi:MoxR-like ATPase